MSFSMHIMSAHSLMDVHVVSHAVLVLLKLEFPLILCPHEFWEPLAHFLVCNTMLEGFTFIGVWKVTNHPDATLKD